MKAEPNSGTETIRSFELRRRGARKGIICDDVSEFELRYVPFAL
jgi:hypothetical protein